MNRFREVVRDLKRRGPHAIACPKCGSLKIRESTSIGGWLAPSLYSCPECGYHGRVVIEIELEENTGVPNSEH
jgi:predicted RNA-binding Zn-ribbon protein involved in translation (DUF1610 family)